MAAEFRKGHGCQLDTKHHWPLVNHQANSRAEWNGFDPEVTNFSKYYMWPFLKQIRWHILSQTYTRKWDCYPPICSLFGKKKKTEGKLSKLSTFLKRQRAFCIPDLSLAEGMLISCWAPALIIPAKAKTYTSWLTLVSTGCWSTPKRLCALLPPAPSQATWYFSEPYIAL